MRELMRRVMAGCLAVVVALTALPEVAWAWSLPEFPADARVLVIDEETGEVVVEQGADERAYPASLTKLMTALVAFDAVGDRLDETVTVGEEVLLTPWDSTVMGLAEGDSFTWRDLLYGMLIPSGSDAALVIATHVGREFVGDPDLAPEGAIGVFVDLMNRKADEMGLSGTHFANVHGFHDDDHYTTARDLLTLAQAARSNDLLRTITGTASYSCTSAEGRELTVHSTNWLLVETAGDMNSEGLLLDEGEPGVANPYYRAAATGIKTGYTGEAGRCLAFACEGNGLSFVGVVLGLSDQPTLYTLMDTAVDALSANFERRTWEATAEPQVLAIENASLVDRLRGGSELAAAAEASLTMLVDTTSTNEQRIVWNEAYVEPTGEGSARLVTVVGKGVQVATVQILRDGELVREVPLLATSAMTPFGNKDIALLVAGGILVLVVLVAAITHAMSRRSRARRRRAVSRGQGRGQGSRAQRRQAGHNPSKPARAKNTRSSRQQGVNREASGTVPAKGSRQPQTRKPSHMRK